MTEEEIEKKARAEYQAAAVEPGTIQIPWDDLPEFRRNYWRELVAGNAGAAEG